MNLVSYPRQESELEEIILKICLLITQNNRLIRFSNEPIHDHLVKDIVCFFNIEHDLHITILKKNNFKKNHHTSSSHFIFHVHMIMLNIFESFKQTN